MHSTRNIAFTLVELLVVITIVVVLLTLLTPALNMALYQAKLVVCAARQKALVSGTTLYAFDNQRRYPKEDTDKSSPETLKHGGFDLRDEIDPYVDINGVFNDPLLHQVEFENAKWENAWLRTANHWYTGWAPINGSPMIRIGDRMKWTDEFGSTPVEGGITLLASDKFARGVDGSGVASHPDMNDVYREGWRQDGEGANPDPVHMQVVLTAGWTANAFAPPTYVGWYGSTPPPERGTLDLNWGYADGGVIRISHIEVFDDRFATIYGVIRVPR